MKIILYEPSRLIISAFQFKGHPFEVGERRQVLREVSGPALTHGVDIVIGEAAILGWLERRYPCPNLFPQELSAYSRAATMAHALCLHPETAPNVWIAIQCSPSPYLFGDVPNFADLALYTTMLSHGESSHEFCTWADGLFTFHNRGNEEDDGSCLNKTKFDELDKALGW